MKVFWSWQSDTDNKTAKDFVKQCIEDTLLELIADSVIDERSEIDHDTKGELGIPSIVDTIFEKINNCDVFIADITPVGKSNTSNKKLINPNVAIELGYMIGRRGYRNIINVMNSNYGDINDLPFDIKHKRGPVLYKLNIGQSIEEVRYQKGELKNQLKLILKQYAGSKVTIKKSQFDLFVEYINNKDLWTEDVLENLITYTYNQDNSFQIIEKGDTEDFSEPWTQVYPDKLNTKKSILQLKYLNTTIKEYSIIYLDGFRYKIIMPKVELRPDLNYWEGKDLYGGSYKDSHYYYTIDGPEYVLSKFLCNDFESVCSRSRIEIKNTR